MSFLAASSPLPSVSLFPHSTTGDLSKQKYSHGPISRPKYSYGRMSRQKCSHGLISRQMYCHGPISRQTMQEQVEAVGGAQGEEEGGGRGEGGQKEEGELPQVGKI